MKGKSGKWGCVSWTGSGCASCEHAVQLGANASIFMASLDKGGDAYDDGSAQVLCLGSHRLRGLLKVRATELYHLEVEG